MFRVIKRSLPDNLGIADPLPAWMTGPHVAAVFFPGTNNEKLRSLT